MGASLVVDELAVRFDGTEIDVLGRISFSLAPGEVCVVLGSSGGGKTTLLRSIAGLQRIEHGRVELDGRDVSDVPPHRRGIGFMFQDSALFPHLDVAGNIEFGLRMAGIDRAARRGRCAEMLELVGLPGFERRSVSELSGGERQRVALARTLAPSPVLLLLDEPMGSLDRVLRDRLIEDLGSMLAELGLTTVHVTHDHSEALALADHVLVLEGGRVLQQGTLDEVVAAPADAHVARLLGRDTRP